ncbi:MAG: CotH kinase family protein, partial [Myxococcota bacterium]|nr:CotH kinase family protein [Myxococcota bacterium]
DWIEIANISGESLNIGGWYLSDDPDDLTRWQLPDRTLAVDGLLLIAASPLPLAGFDEDLRAPFSLKADGEFLALVEPDGETIHQGFESDYPEQRYAVSYGIDPETGEYRYLTHTTPDAPNSGPAYLGFTADPIPDVGRGFYESPFTVSLTGGDDVIFVVSLDGTAPAPIGSSVYSGPVTIEGTSVLRAQAVRPEHLPSRVVTHTYLFLDEVLAQPQVPEGYPSVWQPGVSADYAVDSGVATADALRAALRAVPTLSLVMPVADWFDNDTDPTVGGIYANSEIARGLEWERVGSAELFDFAHGEEIQVTAGIRIYGNASRLISRPKHNLRLVFRRDYGAGKLEFPLFGDDDEPESINSLLLRGQNGDSWIHPNGTQRTQALYIRDQFARSLHERMGRPEVPQGHVNLYINGLYWGLYHTIERIEDASMVRRFGGYEEDWDVIKSSRNPNGMQIVSGTLDTWSELQALAASVGAGEAELS